MTGDLRIDTLTRRSVEFEGVPRFARVFCRRHYCGSPQAKAAQKGLINYEEGVIRLPPTRMLIRTRFCGPGALQLEVLQHRLKSEYSVDVKLNA